MKKLLASLALSLYITAPSALDCPPDAATSGPEQDSYEFLPAGTYYTLRNGGTGSANVEVIFVGFDLGQVQQIGHPEGQWVRVDVTHLGVPSDATSITLQGHFVITHGYSPGYALLELWTRPGEGFRWKYWYELEPWVGGGKRSPKTLNIPLCNGGFDLWWSGSQSTALPYPDANTYGLNFLLEGFHR